MSNEFIYSGGKLEIYCDSEDSCLKFAAAELEKYAKKIAGGQGKGGSVYMGVGKDFCNRMGVDASLLDDGFILAVKDGALILASMQARGVLFAVYEFLRLNGCRFIKAAGIGEYVPVGSELHLSGCYVRNPSFGERVLCISMHEPNDVDWLCELSGIIDWCAKNYINTVYFTFVDINFPVAESYSAPLALIAERGLRLEYGGHGTEKFVPRELYPTQPERFIEKDGKRTPQGNFCVSDERNLQDVSEAVRRIFQNIPQLDVLHPWFEDIPTGSWCECEKCRSLPPNAQQMRIINAIARKIRKESASAEVDMLLYQGTLNNLSAAEKPETNVKAVFAPRERCYAHGIGEESCALNFAMRKKLDEAIVKFGAKNVMPFDYYTDHVLFSRMKTVLPSTIAEDMRYYAKKGIRSVCTLAFGDYSFWAYDMNLYAFARHSFDAFADVDETVVSFCSDLRLPDAARAYYARLEQFSKDVFAFCGYSLQAYCDIRNTEYGEYYIKHIGKVESGISSLRDAHIVLQKIISGAGKETKDYLSYEDKMLQITEAEAELIYGQMRCLHSLAEGKISREQAQEFIPFIENSLEKILSIESEVPAEVKGVAGKVFFQELGPTHLYVFKDTIDGKNKHFKI